jgi:hypothetical protein
VGRDAACGAGFASAKISWYKQASYPPFQKTQGWGTHFVGCVGEIKELTTRPVIRVKRKVKIPNPLSHRTRKKDGATGGEIGES